MSVLEQPRTPAGSPDGGQYASLAGAEAEFSIGVGDDALDAAELMRVCRQAVAVAYRKITPNRVLDPNIRAGKNEPEDLASEVLVRVLERDRQTVELTIQGPTAALVHGVALNVVRDEMRARDRRPNLRARAMLHGMVEEFEQAEGRTATGAERKRFARQILDEWDDPHHRGRPDLDFARPKANVYLNGHESVEPGHADKTAETPAEFYSRAEDQLNAGHKRGHATARALAYNMLAESRGAPMARRACLSKHAVTRVRSAVGTHPGGVKGVIDDWERGVDSDATDALFAPFGNVGDTERRDIVDQLKSGSYTEDLWDSAVSFASARFPIDDEEQS